jgi:hypothetical protein
LDWYNVNNNKRYPDNRLQITFASRIFNWIFCFSLVLCCGCVFVFYFLPLGPICRASLLWKWITKSVCKPSTKGMLDGKTTHRTSLIWLNKFSFSSVSSFPCSALSSRTESSPSRRWKFNFSVYIVGNRNNFLRNLITIYIYSSSSSFSMCICSGYYMLCRTC